MDLFDALLQGFATAATPMNLLWALLGCALGTAVGVLPGIVAPGSVSARWANFWRRGVVERVLLAGPSMALMAETVRGRVAVSTSASSISRG